MPYVYPGKTRVEALDSTLRGEKQLIEKYKLAIDLVPGEEIKAQLKAQLALTREHLYTQKVCWPTQKNEDSLGSPKKII